MHKWRVKLGAIGLLAANTIGAGIFALPYVAKMSGWGVFAAYLLGLGFVLIVVHSFYGRALDRTAEHHRLTGLVKMYLPKKTVWMAAVSILGGLFLTLLAYIVLGASFIVILLPGASPALAVSLMWALGSLPLFLRLKKMVALEFLGTLAMAAIIVTILVTSNAPFAIFSFPAINNSPFLPFGPLLFALAGWTAIGPMREYERKVGFANRARSSSIVWGTILIVILYAAFVMGISGSAASITVDTLSGLANWAPAMIRLLALFGLIAIWTSYIPAAEEARDSLSRDFNWSIPHALFMVFFVPILLISFGFTNFFTIVSLAGGVFLGVQYLFIVAVTKNALRIPQYQRIFLDFAAILFVLGAVYEVYQSVVG
jgi:amino acid permease